MQGTEATLTRGLNNEYILMAYMERARSPYKNM